MDTLFKVLRLVILAPVILLGVAVTVLNATVYVFTAVVGTILSIGFQESDQMLIDFFQWIIDWYYGDENG